MKVQKKKKKTGKYGIKQSTEQSGLWHFSCSIPTTLETEVTKKSDFEEGKEEIYYKMNLCIHNGDAFDALSLAQFSMSDRGTV